MKLIRIGGTIINLDRLEWCHLLEADGEHREARLVLFGASGETCLYGDDARRAWRYICPLAQNSDAGPLPSTGDFNGPGAEALREVPS